jgi:hypothetical protein
MAGRSFLTHGGADELQAWTRQEVARLTLKLPYPTPFSCHVQLAQNGQQYLLRLAFVGCPVLKTRPPRVLQNCIDKWEPNEQGTAETVESTVLMICLYLTAQYTKITYFTNENENVSSRGTGCRTGKQLEDLLPVAAATK